MFGNRQLLVPLQGAVLQRFEGEIDRHHLRQRGRKVQLVRIVGFENRAGLGVDDKMRLPGSGKGGAANEQAHGDRGGRDHTDKGLHIVFSRFDAIERPRDENRDRIMEDMPLKTAAAAFSTAKTSPPFYG
ncbi:hypothetical protein D9M70_550560 [compost metagenome]